MHPESSVSTNSVFQDEELGGSSNQFDLSSEDLIHIIAERDTAKLRSLGGVSGLAKLLHTNLKTGLSSEQINNEQLVQKRTDRYGQNLFKYPPPKSFMSLVFDAFKDLTIIILCVAAVVSLIIGSVMKKKREEFAYLEGIAIVIVVLIVVLVQAIIDKQKEAKFRQLNSVKDQFNVQVKRASNTISITADQLLVGDIIQLSAGDKLPADAIYISGSDLKTNESAMTGEPIDIDKDSEDDAFLLSGTSVSEGVGTAIVIAVGEHSQWGVILKALIVEPEDTPLQKRLDELAWSIGKLGIIFAVLTFSVSFIRFLAKSPEAEVDDSGETGADEEAPGRDWTKVLDFFIDAVTIVVVAIPEGLPLAITLGLAFAMRKMMKDNNLVRRLEACETMGSATQLNADKTGTLTQNRMTVVEAFWQGRHIIYEDAPNDVDDFMSEKYREELCNGMSINTQASLQFSEDGLISHLGNKTECALLQHVHRWGFDYINIRETHKAQRVYMFDSVKKSMSTSEVLPNGTMKIYTKGAPDILIDQCTGELCEDGSSFRRLSESKRHEISKNVNEMASSGLRTLLLAVREINHDIHDKQYWDNLPDDNLNFVGLVGIKDPIRPETKEAVRQLKQAGVTVRMVTGDNALTASFIAKESGILDDDGIVMEGPVFRKLSKSQLRDVALRIQVLARSTPHDKLVLVRALKELGEVTSVTGDGTNDGPALKEANVGFALGIAGTEVAKEACDIVILDDNIQSMTKAVLWGRNVYESIRKFLQFQLVVNVVAVTLNFISACAGQGLPLGAVPLLWVNMIMDSMGALALATEPPRPQLLERKPFGTRAPLINREMYRNIIGVSVYQLIVSLVLQFAGLSIFSLNDESFKAGNVTGREQLNSIIFNVFVFMQIGSELNSRRIVEKNIFDGIQKSVWFVTIIFVTIAIQIALMFGVGSTRVGQSIGIIQIDGIAWGASIVLGALVLPWGFIVRLIPLDWCLGPIDEDPTQKSKLGVYVDIVFGPVMKVLRPIMNMYSKIKSKIPFLKSKTDEEDEDEGDFNDSLVKIDSSNNNPNQSAPILGNEISVDVVRAKIKEIEGDKETKIFNTQTTDSTDANASSTIIGRTNPSNGSQPFDSSSLVRLRVFVHAVAFVNVVSRGKLSTSEKPQGKKHLDDDDAI